VLSARISPASPKLSVLAAPISVAAGEASEASARAASLCGMVTFAPTKPSAGRAMVSSGKSAGGMRIAA